MYEIRKVVDENWQFRIVYSFKRKQAEGNGGKQRSRQRVEGTGNGEAEFDTV